MQIIIEAKISDTEVKKLEEMRYDVNYPFSTNVTLDYGDKVIYGNGKIIIPDMREKIKEYIGELYTEIDRLESDLEKQMTYNVEACKVTETEARLNAIIEVKNDLLGRLEEVV